MLAGTQRVPHYSLISSPQHAHHHYHCSSLLFLFLWAAVAVAVAANPQLQPHPLARAPTPLIFPQLLWVLIVPLVVPPFSPRKARPPSVSLSVSCTEKCFKVDFTLLRLASFIFISFLFFFFLGFLFERLDKEVGGKLRGRGSKPNI